MMLTRTRSARWCKAAALAAGLGMAWWCDGASAQSSGGPLSLFDRLFTGSTAKDDQAAPPAPQPGTSAQAQSAGRGALPAWSGEDGASGHPLMTAAAIREAAANFDTC